MIGFLLLILFLKSIFLCKNELFKNKLFNNKFKKIKKSIKANKII